MITLRTQILHEGRLFGLGQVTPEELAWMIAHPPGDDWRALLAPEGGLGDALPSRPTDGGRLPDLEAQLLCAGRLVGRFTLSWEEVAFVAEHPGAGRFLVAATPGLVEALVGAGRRERAPPAPEPPAAPAAPITPEVSMTATAAVSEPLVV